MKIDESKFRFRIGDKIKYHGLEYTILGYSFVKFFNNYDNEYGYVIHYPGIHEAYRCYNEYGIKKIFTKDAYVIMECEAEISITPHTDISFSDILSYVCSNEKAKDIIEEVLTKLKEEICKEIISTKE